MCCDLKRGDVTREEEDGGSNLIYVGVLDNRQNRRNVKNVEW